MAETSARYQPSERMQKLWDRARVQPDAMFLPMHRPYLYLEGWMAAKDESLPIRNAAGLCNVIENMPLLISAGEIIVGESGDRQCDGMINFQPSVSADYRMSSCSSCARPLSLRGVHRSPLPFHFRVGSARSSTRFAILREPCT